MPHRDTVALPLRLPLPLVLGQRVVVALTHCDAVLLGVAEAHLEALAHADTLRVMVRDPVMEPERDRLALLEPLREMEGDTVPVPLPQSVSEPVADSEGCEVALGHCVTLRLRVGEPDSEALCDWLGVRETEPLPHCVTEPLPLRLLLPLALGHWLSVALRHCEAEPVGDAPPLRDALPQADALPQLVCVRDTSPEADALAAALALRDTSGVALPVPLVHSVSDTEAVGEACEVALGHRLTLRLTVGEPDSEALRDWLPVTEGVDVPHRDTVPLALRLLLALELGQRLGLALRQSDKVSLGEAEELLEPLAQAVGLREKVGEPVNEPERDRLTLLEALREMEGESEPVPLAQSVSDAEEVGEGCEEALGHCVTLWLRVGEPDSEALEEWLGVGGAEPLPHCVTEPLPLRLLLPLALGHWLSVALRHCEAELVGDAPPLRDALLQAVTLPQPVCVLDTCPEADALAAGVALEDTSGVALPVPLVHSVREGVGVAEGCSVALAHWLSLRLTVGEPVIDALPDQPPVLEWLELPQPEAEGLPE